MMMTNAWIRNWDYESMDSLSVGDKLVFERCHNDELNSNAVELLVVKRGFFSVSYHHY